MTVMRKKAIIASLSGTVVVAAIIVGVAWWLSAQGRADKVAITPDTVAVVGNHLVKQADIQPYLDIKVAKQSVLGCMMEQYLYQDMGQKYGVTVTDSQLNAELSARYGATIPYPAALIRLCTRRDLLKAALQLKFSGTVTGQAYILNFDQQLPTVGVNTPIVLTAARKTQYDSDKQAATQLAQQTLAKLKAGQLTFDQAVGQEQADPRFGSKVYPTTIHSGNFRTEVPTDTLGNFVTSDQALSSALASLTPGQISPIITETIPTAQASKSGPLATRYVILKKTTASKPLGESFDQAVSKQKQLGYRVVN